MNNNNDCNGDGNYLTHQVPSGDDKVIWVSEFTDQSLQSFYLRFMYFESDSSIGIIPIIINSYGGSAHTAFAMRDIIKSSVKPVTTVALGAAMSAGVTLLASGTKGLRFASPTSYMMIHEVSTMDEGSSGGKLKLLENNVGIMREYNQKVFQFLSKDTGRPIKDFQKKINNLSNCDWFLTARQARHWRIIDHIGIPRFLESPTVQKLVTGAPFTLTVRRNLNFPSPSAPATK